MSKITEIYAVVLPEMAAHGIEDTLENRLSLLTGLRDGWLEDKGSSVEKAIYVLAVTNEIIVLQTRIKLNLK